MAQKVPTENKQNQLNIKHLKLGAREMSHRLSTLALSENVGPVPSTQAEATQPPTTPVPGDLTASDNFQQLQAEHGTYSCRQNTHTCKN